MSDFEDVLDRLPDQYWACFPDPATAAYARLFEQWALARELKFATLNSDNELPTWFAVDVDHNGVPHPIVTLQAEYTLPNSSGTQKRKGVPDVPFRRLTGPFLSDSTNQWALVKELHKAHPQSKPAPLSIPKWWAFTWRSLAEAGTPGALLAVLDTMVNAHRDGIQRARP